MLEVISDEFERINKIQRARGLHKSRIYEIGSITFDLTSANTGRLGGLGKKLKNLRESKWKSDKEANNIPYRFKETGSVANVPQLLVEKGCEDHLVALISNEFVKRYKPRPLWCLLFRKDRWC